MKVLRKKQVFLLLAVIAIGSLIAFVASCDISGAMDDAVGLKTAKVKIQNKTGSTIFVSSSFDAGDIKELKNGKTRTYTSSEKGLSGVAAPEVTIYYGASITEAAARTKSRRAMSVSYGSTQTVTLLAGDL